MKKKILFLFVPLLLFSLSGCSCNKHDDNPIDPDNNTEEKKEQKYNFYIDYWHSDEIFYTMMWYQGKPLGECPSQCQLTSDDATDPAFTIFLGWSDHSSSNDETYLWNFETSSSLNATINLYGIWASE